MARGRSYAVLAAAVVLAGVCACFLRAGRRKGYQLLRAFDERDKSLEQLRALKRLWEVDEADLMLGPVIGQGGFGEVREAVWRDQAVAVKTLIDMDGAGAEATEELAREATFLQTMIHPNIVRFFGTGTTARGAPFVVGPWGKRKKRKRKKGRRKKKKISMGRNAHCFAGQERERMRG